MCGDFDDHERIDDELFERFLARAASFGVAFSSGAADAPSQLESEEERAAYMQQLFAAGLTRCAKDAGNLQHGDRMDAIAGQAIVFARLAGFLTAQLPPDTDLFRSATNALLDGHAEASRLD